MMTDKNLSEKSGKKPVVKFMGTVILPYGGITGMEVVLGEVSLRWVAEIWRGNW